jgi:anti-anti-sigma regulatory factor
MYDMISTANETSSAKGLNKKSKPAAQTGQHITDLKGDSMTDFNIENRGDAKVLHVSGELVIQHAHRLASKLVESLSDADRVEIDLSSVTNVDISCLQLFCAAHKTSMQLNKLLEFDGTCPDVFKQVVKNAGYLRHAGCVLDVDDTCLWKEVANG